MLYIRPTQKGFEAYDIYHHSVFKETDCEKLFAFLESDPGSFSEKLRTYFEKRIDVDSLEPKEGKVSKSLCEGIKKEMALIHPCLAADRYAGLFAMLAEELNLLLCRKNPAKNPADVIRKDRYTALLRHLFQPLLTIGAEPLPPALVPTSAEFMGKYYTQLESMYRGGTMPSGLDSIEKVREESERYIFWVLDQSSVRFKDLERSTRIRLYSHVFRRSAIGADLRFISNFYWQEPEEYDYFAHTVEGMMLHNSNDGILDDKVENPRSAGEQERENRIKMADSLSRLHSDKQLLSDELKEYMDDAIADAKNDTAETLFEEYRVDDLSQLIRLQLWLLTKGDTIIKRCRHCSRLFIAERASVDYCNRIMDGEKEPCDVVGPKKSFARLMDEDHILKTYNRVYKTIYARMKRGSITTEEFNRWKALARYLLDQTRAGEMSEAKFESWLTQDIRAWGIGRIDPAEVVSSKRGEK